MGVAKARFTQASRAGETRGYTVLRDIRDAEAGHCSYVRKADKLPVCKEATPFLRCQTQ